MIKSKLFLIDDPLGNTKILFVFTEYLVIQTSLTPCEIAMILRIYLE